MEIVAKQRKGVTYYEQVPKPVPIYKSMLPVAWRRAVDFIISQHITTELVAVIANYIIQDSKRYHICVKNECNIIHNLQCKYLWVYNQAYALQEYRNRETNINSQEEILKDRLDGVYYISRMIKIAYDLFIVRIIENHLHRELCPMHVHQLTIIASQITMLRTCGKLPPPNLFSHDVPNDYMKTTWQSCRCFKKMIGP